MTWELKRKARRLGILYSLGLHVVGAVLIWSVPALLNVANTIGTDPDPIEMVSVLPPPPESEPVGPPPLPDPVVRLEAAEIVEKREEAPPPKPPAPPRKQRTVQRQTNRVVRTVNAPEPAREGWRPVDPDAIRRTLASDIPSTAPVVQAGGERDPAVAAYYDRVYQVMHTAWVQPPGVAAGLKTEVVVTVGPDGQITGQRTQRASGANAMDESVMRAVQAVKALPPPPAGFGAPREIVITFIRDS